MKFNSQICTTRSQSEALLKLGLKKETADMVLFEYIDFDVESNCNYKTGEYEAITATYSKNIVFKNSDLIPAWSLHRLIVLNLDTDLPSAYEGIEGQKNIYDEVIDYTEWLIKEGYFNKEYLE